MKPLFLVGYMGCGKSTLGRKIARKLNVAFYDTDKMVEECEGASVADVFHYEGEQRFREVEREMLDHIISKGEMCVISTGGGLPVWQDNMERMNDAGVTVYLKREAEQIARRMSPYGRQKRPRLRGLSDEELVRFMAEDMLQREVHYLKAQEVIDCSKKSDVELVSEISERLREAQ